MRALCGAIVTAGAMIGLGLTALGYGLRFQAFGPDVLHPDSHQVYGGPTLVLILVVLLIGLLVGMGVAFLGLAYHHERRYLEHQRAMSNSTGRSGI
jgi:hypothetical protein